MTSSSGRRRAQRTQLKHRLRPVLSPVEWASLDRQLCDNLVRKAMASPRFAQMSPADLLSVLRAKVARGRSVAAPSRRPTLQPDQNGAFSLLEMKAWRDALSSLESRLSVADAAAAAREKQMQAMLHKEAGIITNALREARVEARQVVSDNARLLMAVGTLAQKMKAFDSSLGVSKAFLLQVVVPLLERAAKEAEETSSLADAIAADLAYA